MTVAELDRDGLGTPPHTPPGDRAGQRGGTEIRADAKTKSGNGTTRSGRRIPHALSDADLQALLAQPNVGCTTGLRDRVILEVMARAGLRVSEVVALRRTDITWGGAEEHPKLRIDDAKGGVDRVVPIDRELVGWLRRWDAERYSYCRSAFFHTVRDSAGVTSSGKHEPLSVRTIQAMVKRYAAQAGLPTEGRRRVTPHTLRHTYATGLIRDGVALEAVRRLLGHANLSTTQIYLHVTDPELQEIIWQRGEARQAQQTLDGQPSAADLALARAIAAMPADAKAALAQALGLG